MKLLAVREIKTCKWIKVCDGRCYGSQYEDCKQCPCAGLNHGVGELKAKENVLTMWNEMQNFVRQTWGDSVELVSYVPMFQMKMFP